MCSRLTYCVFVNFCCIDIMKIVVCTIIEVSAVSNFADLSDILET